MKFTKTLIRKIPFAKALHIGLKQAAKHLTYRRQFHNFKIRSTKGRFSINWNDRFPCLNDNATSTSFDRHYIFHTAWATRILAETQPISHIDISSSLYFVSQISAFIPTQFYDYRPAELNLSGLQCKHANLLHLPFEDASAASLSCMHVIEHVGLGRYGDPLDPDGDLAAIAELKRVLSIDGNLLFVVPIGKPKVMFNAHRIYSYNQIMEYFEELKLIEFSLIPDNAEQGGLIKNASKDLADKQNYGCGCFWFKNTENKH